MSANLVSLLAPAKFQDDRVLRIRREHESVPKKKLSVGLWAVVVEHLRLSRRGRAEVKSDVQCISVDV